MRCVVVLRGGIETRVHHADAGHDGDGEVCVEETGVVVGVVRREVDEEDGAGADERGKLRVADESDAGGVVRRHLGEERAVREQREGEGGVVETQTDHQLDAAQPVGGAAR